MPQMNRRELLTWLALAPTLQLLVRSAEAAQGAATAGDRTVVIVRMLGGNDVLNTVVPIRDDRYYKLRPTIAIARQDAIAMPGGELGLNPWLTDVRRLMDDGHAAIVQGVGYARPSRSHLRSTEIQETASLSDPAPAHGWLGRYLDHACECGGGNMAGVQFGSEFGKTLASKSGRGRLVGNTQLLMDMDASAIMLADRKGPANARFDRLVQAEQELAEASRRLHQAARGTGSRFDYPDSPFGQSLRWTGNMIQSGSPVRVFYVSIGSFEAPQSVSFDTHIGQLDAHKVLFTELGRGLRAFADHLKQAGALDRTLLLTFSDFGRHVAENRTAGTEHGDAGCLFAMGGALRPGLLGTPADIGKVHDGGLDATTDFRQVYADVLTNWLGVDAATILGERVTPFSLVRT